MEKELKLKMVIAYLGSPKEIRGDEYIWPCPLCREEGRDTDGDHLKFNPEKGYLTCFRKKQHWTKLKQEIFEYWEKCQKEKDYCPETGEKLEGEITNQAVLAHLLEIKEFLKDIYSEISLVTADKRKEE